MRISSVLEEILSFLPPLDIPSGVVKLPHVVPVDTESFFDLLEGVTGNKGWILHRSSRMFILWLFLWPDKQGHFRTSEAKFVPLSSSIGDCSISISRVTVSGQKYVQGIATRPYYHCMRTCGTWACCTCEWTCLWPKVCVVTAG